MSRLKLSVNLPKGLEPAAAEQYAQAAVDELARAYSATKPHPRPRGGLRTSFSSGADPIVLVFPRDDLSPAFDQLLDRGAWADPTIAYLVAALGAAIYGLTESAAVLALTASHGVALRTVMLWNRQPDRPFDLSLRVSTTALQLAFDPTGPDDPAGVAKPLSVVVSAQTIGTRALAAVCDNPDGWLDVAAELLGILRRKYAAAIATRQSPWPTGDFEPAEPGVVEHPPRGTPPPLAPELAPAPLEGACSDPTCSICDEQQ